MSAIQKTYRAMNRFSNVAQKLLELIVALLVLSCAADLFLQVINRFILVKYFELKFSMTWTTEYAQDAIVWITYFAIGICYKENSMASVNFIYDRLKGVNKFLLYCVTRIVIVFFLFVGFKYGWQAIQAVSDWTSTSLHLPGWSLYSAPFVGCLFIAYEVVTEFLGVLCGDLEPFAGRPPVVEETQELTAEEQSFLQDLQDDITK